MNELVAAGLSRLKSSCSRLREGHGSSCADRPLRRCGALAPELRRSGSARFFLQRLKSCALILTATLREIFDESAYARFLNQKQLVSSRSAYAAFRQEYEGTKARRPRCC